MKICIVENCEGKYFGKGYCKKHYARFLRYGSPDIVLRNKDHNGKCSIDRCENKYYGKGYCSKHYARFLKHGSADITLKNKDPERKCSISGCNNKYRTNGYCQKHYFQYKLQTDLEFKITNNLRRRLHNALKGKVKTTKTLELLGCTLKEFKEYLEAQFREGMTWENYGYYGWHIDHIIPCSKFDLTDSSQQKECFHYTNLQPLWMKENLSKNRFVLGGEENAAEK